MNDFEKIEHLLLSKRFEDLSPTELNEVSSYFETATDYNDMRDTLMQVKSTLAADKLLIKPSIELKEKLLQKFDNTYTNQGGTNSGKSKPFYKSVSFQWSAAATIVLVACLSIFGYIQNIKNQQNNHMAVNFDGKEKQEKYAPSEENVTGGVIADSTVAYETSTNKVMVNNPNNMVSTSTEDDRTYPTVVGNTFSNETEIMEGDANVSKDVIKTNNGFTIGSNYSDNTAVDTKNSNRSEQSEEKKDKNDFYFNGVLNGESTNEIKSEDERVTEPNKSIPVSTQSIFNTNVNYQQTTYDRDYWKKKKEKNNKEVSNANLGLAQDKLIEFNDSSKVRLDSLKLNMKDSVNLPLKK